MLLYFIKLNKIHFGFEQNSNYTVYLYPNRLLIHHNIHLTRVIIITFVTINQSILYILNDYNIILLNN